MQVSVVFALFELKPSDAKLPDEPPETIGMEERNVSLGLNISRYIFVLPVNQWH